MLVAIGLVYVVQGYSVPRWWYPVTLVAAVVAAGLVWCWRRQSHADASAFADRFFGLKDSVTSCRNFAERGRQGGFFDLQADQTNRRVNALQPHDIPFEFPTRSFAMALVLGTAAALLAFKAPSSARLQEVALRQATEERTSFLNKELEALVEQLDQEVTDEDERELVEPDKLREWVKDLKATTDIKDALRQYAKLEQKLHQASARLEQKRDEQYLERAAKELDKGEETKSLAKSLQQKKYDEAAERLNKMKPEETKPLSEQRKDLARLMAAAKRMSAAARNAEKKSHSSQPNPSRGQQATPKAGDAANRNSASQSQRQTGQASRQSPGEQGESVEQLVQDLEQSLDELSEQLAKAEQQEQQDGEVSDQMLGECKACQGKAGQKLGKLSKKLGRMALKKKAQSKLASLCQACGQCQSQCAGTSPGGHKAGWGSSDRRREEREELVDNGQFTQLKGIKGQGPSITAVEAADDGTGVSHAKHTARNRSFQRQLESFVQREDVPDDVKAGVQRYFENIHQVEAASESK